METTRNDWRNGPRPNPFKGTPTDTLLAQWMREHKVSRYAIAMATGIPVASLSKWMKGAHMPSLVAAYKIDEFTKGEVPPSSWLGTAVGRWTYENYGIDGDGLKARRRIDYRRRMDIKRVEEKRRADKLKRIARHAKDSALPEQPQDRTQGT